MKIQNLGIDKLNEEKKKANEGRAKLIPRCRETTVDQSPKRKDEKFHAD